ncbi:unnamed protein product, partial [Mesorhabditis belari]|uniref:UDP-N-acetylglucosamine diphosphorylase n=1 Tax=Mesorhabditis belari TaxID=2138241 RepID=A0AAF3EK68_9BILA
MSTREALADCLGSQKHLLQFWDELDEEQKTNLTVQLEEIDVDECKKAFIDSKSIHVPDFANVRPVPSSRYVVSSKLSTEEFDRLFQVGLEAISRNELCVLVLAGGQASRLGSLQPKGILPLGLPVENGVSVVKGDSLLALQASKISRLQGMAAKAFPGSSGKIHWAVMTSRGTHEATVEHLKTIVPLNGLSINDVTVFSQSNLPTFDFSGDLFLAKKDELSTAPNGHGGVHSALAKYLPKLRAHGVKYIQTHNVDNVLCRVGDPAMLGMMLEKKADCASKTLEKQPGDLVGSVIMENGRPRVIEYSELGDLEAQRDDDGKLLYRAGSINIHFFELNFLERVYSSSFQLPYHRAVKRVDCVNEHGVTHRSLQPNAIKLEQFIFDIFPISNNFYCWEVIREDEFSPWKNEESVGIDCLSTCIRALADQSRRWLEQVGAECPHGKQVFLVSSRSYCGEDLEEYCDKHITDTVIQ